MDWKSSLQSAFAEELQHLPPEAETPAPEAKRQHLRVELDKRGKGKVATLITGFAGAGAEAALAELAKTLKTRCGSGGSVRDGEILVQGDFRDKIALLLAEMGHRVRKIG